MQIQIHVSTSASLNQSEQRLLSLVKTNKSHLVDSRDKRMVNAMNSLEKKRLVDVKARAVERFGFTFYDVVLPDEEQEAKNAGATTIEQDFVKLGGDAAKLRAVPKEHRLDAVWEWLYSVQNKPKAVAEVRRKINHLWATVHQRKLTTVDPMHHIKIAADSISKLRTADVMRVLESAGDQASKVAYFIVRERPDLKSEVVDVMDEELKKPIYIL